MGGGEGNHLSMVLSLAHFLATFPADGNEMWSNVETAESEDPQYHLQFHYYVFKANW